MDALEGKLYGTLLADILDAVGERLTRVLSLVNHVQASICACQLRVHQKHVGIAHHCPVLIVGNVHMLLAKLESHLLTCTVGEAFRCFLVCVLICVFV